MPSRNTLVWIGATASAAVVAGASALYWTHPDFLWWNLARARIVVGAPAEPKAETATAPAMKAAKPPAELAKAAAEPAKPAKEAAQHEEAAKEAAAPPPPAPPAFDVVNVDPSGDAVVAGRAAPNAKVELRDAGKTVAVATADSSGQFVIIPPSLAPGDHSLSLSAGAETSAPETSKTIAVSVPAPAPAPPKAAAPPPALEAKTEAAPLAHGMRTIATPPAASGARVAIQAVEADAEGGLFAKGWAEPNATVRLYLNQAPVAEARTQADGRWSLTISSGMTAGDYLMRADELAGSSVVATVSTPFAYPEASAPALATPAPPPTETLASASPGAARSPADPVLDSVQTKRVVSGHTLWGLSQNYYGDPTRYPVIVDANKWVIHNPNLIYPGEVFVVPKFAPKP